LLPDFAPIHSRNLDVFITPDMYTGDLLRRSPGGTTLSTWAVAEVVSMGATLSSPDTSPGAPGEVRLESAFIEAAGTCAVLVNLTLGLSVPLAVSGTAGDYPSARQQCAHRDALLPSGGLDTGGVPRDSFSSLFPLSSWMATF
jgi:hypothetical protein